jgi:hypothetical protein
MDLDLQGTNIVIHVACSSARNVGLFVKYKYRPLQNLLHLRFIYIYLSKCICFIGNFDKSW